jgi:4-amino-4-deoxy-L-arabinose transferase-like glycosyltransferase
MIPGQARASDPGLAATEAHQPSGLHNVRSWIGRAGITLLAAALRLYRLDSQSVWYDEIFAMSVSRLPFRAMQRMLVSDVVHPPLHYYALHLWFQAFGFGPVAARLLSVIFGCLAVVMMYVLGRYLFDARAGWISSLLLGCSQLGVMYSQEARPYAQFLFLFLACAYLFVRAIREKRLRLWITFVGSASLLIYTHYYGFLVLGSLAFFALCYRKRYRLSRAWILGAVLALAVAYTPWLSSGVVGEAMYGAKMHRGPVIPGSRPPSERWYTPAAILNTFGNGRPNGVLDEEPWWTFLAGGLLFGAPAALAFWPLLRRESKSSHEREEDVNVIYMAILLIAPIALALTAGPVVGFYNIRYVAFCAAPYYILTARGIGKWKAPWLRWTFVVLLLAYSAQALRANYYVPYKEDYRGAYSWIARDYRPGDCAVVAQAWEERQARWAWDIYEGSRPGPLIQPLDAATSAGGCGRVWLLSVAYRETAMAVEAGKAARRQMDQKRAAIEQRRFFWIDLSLYGAAQ